MPTNEPVGQEIPGPFALPADMTPAQAQARLEELRTDRDFGARFIAGDKRAAAEFDLLTRRSIDMPAVEPKPEPSQEERAMAALEPPARPEDYRIEPRDPDTGMVMKLDEETQALLKDSLLPAAHALGLSQHDIDMATMAVTKPMSWDQCDEFLHHLWGRDYDARLNDFRAAVTDPKYRALLEKYPEVLGNSGPLIASTVAAYRRRSRV